MPAVAPTEEVERVLDGLADRAEPRGARLERRPGRKEARYADALVPRDATPAPTAEHVPVTATVAELAAEVAALRAELAELRSVVDELTRPGP